MSRVPSPLSFVSIFFAFYRDIIRLFFKRFLNLNLVSMLLLAAFLCIAVRVQWNNTDKGSGLFFLKKCFCILFFLLNMWAGPSPGRRQDSYWCPNEEPFSEAWFSDTWASFRRVTKGAEASRSWQEQEAVISHRTQGVRAKKVAPESRWGCLVGAQSWRLWDRQRQEQTYSSPALLPPFQFPPVSSIGWAQFAITGPS